MNEKSSEQEKHTKKKMGNEQSGEEGTTQGAVGGTPAKGQGYKQSHKEKTQKNDLKNTIDHTETAHGGASVSTSNPLAKIPQINNDKVSLPNQCEKYAVSEKENDVFQSVSEAPKVPEGVVQSDVRHGDVEPDVNKVMLQIDEAVPSGTIGVEATMSDGNNILVMLKNFFPFHEKTLTAFFHEM